MALTVEDGYGRTDANSYISVSDADTYHSDRGNSSWTDASEAEKEQALILATEYLDTRYYYRWKGYKKRETQSLEWPRDWVYDRNGWLFAADEIPQRLKEATAEAALRSLSETLYPDVTRDDMVRKTTVGPISIDYKESAPSTTQFTKVDRILRGLIKPSGSLTIGRS